MNKAIIGGTGVNSLPNLKGPYTTITPHGNVETYRFTIKGEEILFLPRHGLNHTTPPHNIPYRANIYALKELGVSYIYALATSGSIHKEIPVGSIVVIDDFLDFTTNRVKTYFDGSDSVVAHCDMSDPYCSNLRKSFIQKANEKGIKIIPKGVYVCTDGPRFESKSEINMYKILKGDIVGMTGIPEVLLAKELGICYASIGLISNMACGVNDENLASIDHKNEIIQAKIDTIDIISDLFCSIELNQNRCECTTSVLYL
ncbi:MAG: S-methyl-5'-thioadenosine phosphorylase [Spirochaetia bacterium]|nr:S-methyl-5'-thioadenosine phosphorylase [Spirochaetia bacterium]